jgi:hypothetical protein
VCAHAQAAKSKAADARCARLGEAVAGAKVVKLYAWEAAVERSVQAVRTREARLLLRFAQLRLFTTALSLATPAATLLAMLACRHALAAGRLWGSSTSSSSEDLSLATLFTALALVGTLQAPLMGVSDGLASCAQVDFLIALYKINKRHPARFLATHKPTCVWRRHVHISSLLILVYIRCWWPCSDSRRFCVSTKRQWPSLQTKARPG